MRDRGLIQIFDVGAHGCAPGRTAVRPYGGIFLCLLTLACNPAPPPDDTPEKPLVRTVVTEPARQILLRDTVQLSAEVMPWAAVTVAAEITGRVVELPAEVGDEIGAGTPVGRIDDATARVELARTQAEATRARVALTQAERDLERGRELAKTQDISTGDLDRLNLERDTASAELAAAEARRDLYRQNADKTVVRAPFAGVVSERFVEVGSWISPGAPVVRLVSQRRVKVRGSATQRDRARLSVDLPARVTVDALPGTVFEGEIRVLGQEADAETGTYLVEVAVAQAQNEAGRLLSGMQGSIEVEIGAREALVIPRAALVTTADGEGVFVVDDGTVRFVRPQAGVVTEDRLEIVAGLAAGDDVVVVGQHVLHDGDPVIAAAPPR